MAGVIRQLEKSLNHLLQWRMCLLQANKLFLRYLFEAVDGATSGPSGFSGSIGKRLLTCSKQPVFSHSLSDTDRATFQPGSQGIKH